VRDHRVEAGALDEVVLGGEELVRLTLGDGDPGALERSGHGWVHVAELARPAPALALKEGLGHAHLRGELIGPVGLAARIAAAV
jgi:hypothetical protein